MSAEFRLFPGRGLVFFRLSGAPAPAELRATLRACLAHPDFRPGLKQLVDLGGVTGLGRDPCGMLALQAEQLELVATDGSDTLIVHHAPTRAAQDLSRQLLPPRGPMTGIIPLLQIAEADALSLLGQPETCFADLLHQQGPQPPLLPDHDPHAPARPLVRFMTSRRAAPPGKR